MAAQVSSANAEIEVFRHQARSIHQVVHMQTEGVTQDESLVQPRQAGNCLNWVVGHLITVYNNALQLLGQEAVGAPDVLARYQRGSLPMEDAAHALQLNELLALWDQVNARVDAGLSTFPAERLDQPAPFSPTGSPNETVRTLLSTIMFHQAYHTGQTALLRRVIGKPGAIR